MARLRLRFMVINGIIFVLGLILYAGNGLWGLCCLALCAVMTWLVGLGISKKPWLLWLGVGFDALVLLTFKLQGVLSISLFSVMGISYFGLQSISYMADVYRGKYPAEKNFWKVSMYLSYLPHLYVGPIERYDVFMPRLEARRFCWENAFAGAARALWGGMKKLVIASRIGVLTSAIAAAPDKYQGGYALAAMLLYSVQLYADFSGGMDMVIGVSKILGIDLSENFRTPYFSQTVKEFWNRWHMTLGSWLKDYVYIPLGGNRKGSVRRTINLLITFLVSGLWHGVHYLLWGFGNGVLVALGDSFKTKFKTLNRCITFVLISFLWAFFVWPDTKTALQMQLSVFTTFNYGQLLSGIAAMGLTVGDFVVLAVAALALWLYDWKQASIHSSISKWHPAAKTALLGTLAILLLVFGMYGLGFQADSFIYSRF